MTGATTRALLQKDSPWLGVFAGLGTVGLVLALLEHGFLFGFVIGPGSRDALFHVSWSLGLALGLAAACFDELLGTTDLLRQRALPPFAVDRARLVGCALVLACWFGAAPAAAWAIGALFDPTFALVAPSDLPSLAATMTPAVSGCAIGLAAGALPFPWWVRVPCAALLLFATSTATYWLSIDDRGPGSGWVTSWSRFAAAHLTIALAVLAFARASAAASGGAAARDADRPLPARVRTRVVAPLLALGGLGAAMAFAELQANAASRLQRAYPRPLVHDQRVVLAVRPEWERPWQVVDADHVPTGPALPWGLKLLSFSPAHVRHSPWRLEAPRGPHPRTAGFPASLTVGGDGTAWYRPRNERVRRVPKRADAPRFAEGTRVEWVGAVPPDRALACLEPGGDVLWLLDADGAGFTPLPLPGGDRALAFTRPDERFVPAAGSERLGKGADEFYVQGREGVYALRGHELRLVGTVRAPERDREPPLTARVLGADPIGWTLVFAGKGGVAPFRHDFAPRTATERTFAWMAMMLSTLRPPVLQLAALVRTAPPYDDQRPGSGERAPWLFDPLVTAGRWWLALLALAVAALAAWRVRARLRLLGAAPAAVRFWTIATLLLGPFGAIAAMLCERPRAWARRELAVPPPAPRIVSPSPEEVPA
jgi:hypothetical protein